MGREILGASRAVIRAYNSCAIEDGNSPVQAGRDGCKPISKTLKQQFYAAKLNEAEEVFGMPT